MLEIGGVNLVLAWDENNLVLIDTGFPGQTDDIVKAIANAGFKAKELTHIIITHQDWGHIGCLMDLQKKRFIYITTKGKNLCQISEFKYPA